jgi:hypothetical protein
VYWVKDQKTVNNYHPWLQYLPSYVSYLLYFAIPVILTYLSLILSKYLSDDNIESQDGRPVVKEIEQANNAYLPSYLGYFFVALGVPYCETLVFVFVILFCFTFLSQTLYFNPLFLIFGYHFYYIKTETNIKIFLITKRNLKNPRNLTFPKLKRINDFTFIER